jgi:hypothetical protein
VNNRQERRQSLTESILAHVRREVDGVLTEAKLSDEAREKIKNGLVGDTEQILDACTLDELQSVGAFEKYLRSCIRDAEVQVRQFRPEKRI